MKKSGEGTSIVFLQSHKLDRTSFKLHAEYMHTLTCWDFTRQKMIETLEGKGELNIQENELRDLTRVAQNRHII